jgi:biotin carboxylase
MNRKQRIRVCGNLQQLIETAPSTKLRERYRKQYVSTASRINEKQLTGVGAGELSITRQNILTLN